MTKKCFHCGKEVTDTEFWAGLAVKTIHDLYAHTRCIDNHGKESAMSDQTKDILGAADYAHQSIGLAKELLQESLGNMGQILTHGCMRLGPASLGSAMRLGQLLKEGSFLLGDLLKNAHGLCVLLGKDLGVREDIEGGLASEGERGKRAAAPWYKSSRALGDDPEPGKDEFDGDEQPF